MDLHYSTACRLTFISLQGILDLGLLVMEDILPALALRYLRTCRRSQVHHWVWIHIAVWDRHRNVNDRVVGMVAVAVVGVVGLRRHRVEASEVACHTDEV